MRGARARIDARGRQQQERVELQLGQTTRDEADMRLCRVQRAHAEVAGEADAVDDMAGRPTPRQQYRQRRPCDRMDHLVVALQPSDQRRSDEAAGAEDGEG